VNQVLPGIHSRRPDVALFLVGSNPSPDIRALASAQIVVTGFVSDQELAAYYENARVVVAPLRFGAGVKGKIVEAMRFGVPVVTTRTGIQGFEGACGIQATDTPTAFADRVLQLLEDDQEWKACASAEVAYAQTHFSEQAMYDAIANDFGINGEAEGVRSRALSGRNER
jgi:glycosyltransferase involved in cell wall biosynthesis